MPVDRSQNRQALVGGLILGGLLFLFLSVFFLADVRRALTPTDQVLVLMPSAAGLQAGSEVWIAGKPVGEVGSIHVRPPGVDSMRRVAVRTVIKRKFTDHIRRDSEARVTSFSMIGDPVLDITPGTPTMPGLEHGDSLLMRAAGSPAATIASVRSLNENFQQLLAHTRTLATPARERGAQVAQLIRHLDVTKREFAAFTIAMQEGTINVLSDPEFNGVMNSLGQTISQLRASFARAAQRARAARNEAAPALEQLAARTDTIAQQIDRLQNAIDASGGGFLIRAQTDTAIIKALHGAQLQLDSLIAESQRQPWRFWF